MDQKQPNTEIEISLPWLIIIVVAIAAAIYAGVYFFGGKQDDKKQPETIEESLADVTSIPLKDIELVGNSTSPYVFLTVSDFECPLCQTLEIGRGGSVKSTADLIKEQYVDTGKIRTGFVPYIIRPEHKPAALNENIGYFCARDQGKGADYVKAVFKKTATNGYGLDLKGTERAALLSLAKDMGLNIEEFTGCYDKRDVVRADTIEQMVNNAIRKPWVEQKGNWFGTPTMVICKIDSQNNSVCSGKAFVGAYPFEDIKGAIDNFITSVN